MMGMTNPLAPHRRRAGRGIRTSLCAENEKGAHAPFQSDETAVRA
jgi:hypothetical protein